MMNTSWLTPEIPHFSIFPASSTESQHGPVDGKGDDEAPSLIFSRIRFPSFSLIWVSRASLAPSGVFSSVTWITSSLQ